MNRADADAMLAEIRANGVRLARCEGPHGFVSIDGKLFSRHRCTRCGGEVQHDQALWYKRGLAHGPKAI